MRVAVAVADDSAENEIQKPPGLTRGRNKHVLTRCHTARATQPTLPATSRTRCTSSREIVFFACPVPM